MDTHAYARSVSHTGSASASGLGDIRSATARCAFREEFVVQKSRAEPSSLLRRCSGAAQSSHTWLAKRAPLCRRTNHSQFTMPAATVRSAGGARAAVAQTSFTAMEGVVVGAPGGRCWWRSERWKASWRGHEPQAHAARPSSCDAGAVTDLWTLARHGRALGAQLKVGELAPVSLCA